jgi:uncharacterized RDD family membrane protein YckC
VSTAHDTQRVTTADNVGISFRVAGLATRITAALLDLVTLLCILFVVTVLIVAIAGAIAGTQGGTSAIEVVSLAGLLIAACWVLLAILYFTVVQAVSAGRTPGKTAMGLRVIAVDGGTASLGAYFLRSAAYIVDVAGVGLILMFFHPQSRRFGDLLAGTVVVRERTPVTLLAATAPSPVYLRSNDPGPAIDGLENLGEHELMTIRIFLSRLGLRPDQRADLATQLAKRLLDRMELPSGAPERIWPPELLLERLYLQLTPRFEHGGSFPVQRLDPYGVREPHPPWVP